MGETMAIGVAAIILFVYLILFGFLIATYVLQSLALHTLARRRGIANPWLAWLPYGNFWIIGAIARDYDKQNNICRRWDKTMLILSIVFSVSYIVTYIGAFVGTMIAALNIDAATMPEEAAVAIMLIAIFMFIPIMVIAVALQIITYICFFKIFESTVPEKALKYFLLILFVPFAQPVCLFLCRNKGYAHPDPMAYLYAPVDKNYTYYKQVPQPTESEETVEAASETPTATTESETED